MRLGQRWAWVAGVALAVIGLLGLIAVLLLPDEQELAARASAELEKRLGVKTTVGTLRWQLRPAPVVVLEDITTDQPEPIRIARLVAYPQWRALLRQELVLSRVLVEGATVAQVSLRGLGSGAAAAAGEPGALQAGVVPLERLAFRDLTWISRRGIATVYAGEIDFDAQWRPRTAEVRRTGAKVPARLALVRQDQQDAWKVQIEVGGGSANGAIELATNAGGRMQLRGQLKPREIEVESTMAAFNRRSIIRGKASGTTTLRAAGDSLGELGRSLRTSTQFTMGPSMLLRFDLDRAVRSFGQEHAGQTPLDSVVGRLDTQNTAQGMVARYSDVKARSGALTASGDATLANRTIEGEFAVDLVDGIVGVPLKVSGPVDSVSVSMPKGAVAGAVAGTAVLPGVGTALGARIGATLGKMFGSDNKPPAPPAESRR